MGHLHELRGSRRIGISARMLFEVLGDSWAVKRRPTSRTICWTTPSAARP
ncbi:MAG: DUF3683 domain-containing protein [Arhodomonas sp.]|nr:DUF3683 domain-containing protein [Arhodomonas sp.]